jgi:hypothetical protein
LTRAARIMRLRFLALSLEFLREQRFLFFFTCRFLYRYIAYSDYLPRPQKPADARREIYMVPLSCQAQGGFSPMVRWIALH